MNSQCKANLSNRKGQNGGLIELHHKFDVFGFLRVLFLFLQVVDKLQLLCLWFTLLICKGTKGKISREYFSVPKPLQVQLAGFLL